MFYKDKATNPHGLHKTLTVLLNPFLIYKYLKGFFFFSFSLSKCMSLYILNPLFQEKEIRAIKPTVN